MVESKKEPVVVIGLGRFGSSLALELAASGTDVLAIDSSPKLVQNLSNRLPHVVTADSTDIEALRQLGVPDFYRAVVAIGTDIEASILTASLLIELEISDIWAKAISRQHGQILTRLGVQHVVLPEHDMGERVAHLVGATALNYVELEPDLAQAVARPPREIVGTPMSELGMWEKHRVAVSFVKRPDQAFEPVTGETVLTYDDVIVVGGPPDDVEHFVERP